MRQFDSHGSRDGAEVRALASHQCGPGSILALWVEFVVGSRLVPRPFLRVLQFSHKNQHLQISHSTKIEDPHENQLRMMWLPL